MPFEDLVIVSSVILPKLCLDCNLFCDLAPFGLPKDFGHLFSHIYVCLHAEMSSVLSTYFIGFIDCCSFIDRSIKAYTPPTTFARMS